MNSTRDYLSPIARLMLALVFIVAGFQKIGAYQETVTYMESQGIPGLLLPAAAAAGRFTRLKCRKIAIKRRDCNSNRFSIRETSMLRSATSCHR